MRAPLLLAAILVAPVALAHDGADDCGSGGDAPYALVRGIVIAPATDCWAHFGGSVDERDAYRVPMEPGQRLVIDVTPASPGPRAWVQLYEPDRDGDGLHTPAAVGYAPLAIDATIPGEWPFFLQLYQNATGTFAHADYRLVVRAEGDAWPVDAHEGKVALPAPAGSLIDRVLGPADREPLDGAWIELAVEGDPRHFIRVATQACVACLDLAFRGPSGGHFAGHACQRDGGALSCRPPAGATHALVSARQGTDVAFTLLHWHP